MKNRPSTTGDRHWTHARSHLLKRGAKSRVSRLDADGRAAFCAAYEAMQQPNLSKLARERGIGRTTAWRYLREAGKLRIQQRDR